MIIMAIQNVPDTPSTGIPSCYISSCEITTVKVEIFTVHNSANSKTCESICDSLYTHFGYVVVVY